MLVVYYSLTGNIKRFLDRTHYKNVLNIKDADNIKEPYVLITNTLGFGEVPPKVKEFLKSNSNYLKGVISSGNRNWGPNFAKAGDIISSEYNVPLLMKIELHGTDKDINLFNERMQTI